MIERLRAMDCDVAQGFHWSRPVPADELPAVLARLTAEMTAGSTPIRS